jgi:regulator of sigma E protease
MTVFINILLFLSSIIISMIVHEFGHFIFAKMFKVNVFEYSIGIGPKLFSFKTKKGMRWSFRIGLIAAYVSIDSNNMRKYLLDSDKEEKKNIAREASAKNLKVVDSCRLWQKLLINVGGVMFNAISVAIIILGIYSAGYSIQGLGRNVVSIFESIYKLLTFQTGKSTGVGIVSNVSTVATINSSSYGLLFVSLLFSINLSLAIVNFLPLPPLDGFKILGEVIKSSRKKPMTEKTEKYLNIFVLILLSYFIIAVVVSEIRNFYGPK